MALAQAGDDLASRFAPGQGEDGGVDRFTGPVACGLVGEGALQGSGNLLGRPLPLKHRQDNAPVDAVYIEHGRRTDGALTCHASLLGDKRAIGLIARGVGLKLATDGRSRACSVRAMVPTLSSC